MYEMTETNGRLGDNLVVMVFFLVLCLYYAGSHGKGAEILILGTDWSGHGERPITINTRHLQAFTGLCVWYHLLHSSLRLLLTISVVWIHFFAAPWF